MAYRSLVAVSSDNSAADSAIPKRQPILKDAKLVQLTPVEATMNMPCLGMSYHSPKCRSFEANRSGFSRLSLQQKTLGPLEALQLNEPCKCNGMNVITFSSPTLFLLSGVSDSKCMTPAGPRREGHRLSSDLVHGVQVGWNSYPLPSEIRNATLSVVPPESWTQLGGEAQLWGMIRFSWYVVLEARTHR